VQHGVVGDVVVEFDLLFSVWQIAIEQEIADFEEIRVFRQLFDRITAMEENPVIAVNIGDLGFATARRDKSWIVGNRFPRKACEYR
jgi:hypothetical protein